MHLTCYVASIEKPSDGLAFHLLAIFTRTADTTLSVTGSNGTPDVA
jgi:hypothetical protein